VARELSNEGRSAVTSYFDVPLGSENNKTIKLSYPLHPLLSRSYEILEPMFIESVLPDTGYGLLSKSENWNQLLSTLPPAGKKVSQELLSKWNSPKDDSTAKQKWSELVRYIKVQTKSYATHMSSHKSSKKVSNSERIKLEQWPVETVFRYTYPRLDINVSKMQNHLLKSPFCIHPKTGRVCVPISMKDVDTFDPFKVPTMPQLMRQLDAFKKTDCQDEDQKVKHEWEKTALKHYFSTFQKEQLTPMLNELRRTKKVKAEKMAAITGNF